MFARKLLTGVAAVAMSVTALTLTAGAASATTDPQPDDTAGTPTLAMLVGVGSDTSQHVVKVLGDGYNATTPTPAASIYNYAACATPTTCGQITLPTADITRPNGSGAGRATLYGGAGGNGNTDIDFARSSSIINATEVAAGLQMFPFALDTVVTATSGNVASYAPASLTAQQLYNIYSCQTAYRNWSAFGGPNQTINVLIPPSTSGTYDFFLTQIASQSGNTKQTSGSCWTTVQEHDPASVKNDPAAIAPFSQGRAALETAAGNKVTVEGGFTANRALYNVVRGANVSTPAFTAVFGSAGYFCSPAAKPLIEASGFKQLRTPSQGGACGAPTQTATSNFVTDVVATTTSVTVTGASASTAKIVAAVGASSAPSGTVTFSENGTPVATSIPLVSGAATATVPASPGTHTYRAVFTPSANTAFTGSEGTGTGSVQKGTSSIKADFPKKVKFGKKAKGTVTVTLTGTGAKATGVITITEGSKVVGTGTLSGGVVKITLKKKLKPGKHKLTVTWPGDTNAGSSAATVKIKALPKPKKK